MTSCHFWRNRTEHIFNKRTNRAIMLRSLRDRFDHSKWRQSLQPCTIGELEAAASKQMNPIASDFVANAAGECESRDENRRAFQRCLCHFRILFTHSFSCSYVILPDYFSRDVSNVDISCSLLNAKVHLKAPIGFSPTGLQKFSHRDGEQAVARGM